MVPVSPRIKVAQSSSRVPPDIGFRVCCKVERQGGAWEGLGWAFRRTAATCSQRETAGYRPIYLDKKGPHTHTPTLPWASQGDNCALKASGSSSVN